MKVLAEGPVLVRTQRAQAAVMTEHPFVGTRDDAPGPLLDPWSGRLGGETDAGPALPDSPGQLGSPVSRSAWTATDAAAPSPGSAAQVAFGHTPLEQLSVPKGGTSPRAVTQQSLECLGISLRSLGFPDPWLPWL